MNSNSQAFQDIFALQICKNKTYIEIGANRPIKRNNTYLLEKNHFFGYSVEYNPKWQRFWKKANRSNKIYFADATIFDYANAAIENNLKNTIGYLSCDIEPVTNTFAALQKVVNDGMTFDCITFEHDIYQSKVDLRKDVDAFMQSHGYKIAVTDVYLYPEKEKVFETWYVNNNIEFKTCSFDQWLKTLEINKTSI